MALTRGKSSYSLFTTYVITYSYHHREKVSACENMNNKFE